MVLNSGYLGYIRGWLGGLSRVEGFGFYSPLRYDLACCRFSHVHALPCTSFACAMVAASKAMWLRVSCGAQLHLMLIKCFPQTYPNRDL